jgi:methylated-DNA-[protein]-cysteine S-methyltransferase
MNVQNPTTSIESPLGNLRATADSGGGVLIGLDFLATAQESSDTESAAPVFAALRRWLNAYFDGEQPQVTIPLALHGSAFQRSVWELLRHIAYGQTASYGALARHVQSSPRAVGGAVGRNPLSILVPCHRVIGSDGNLRGYSGGIERKIALLRREGITLPLHGSEKRSV